MTAASLKVDGFIRKSKQWQKELQELRKIVLDCDLTEELKWGVPCYTLDGSNIVLIHTFKEYCALLFFKGALLKDPKGVLVQQTKNTQAARQIRFTNVQDVVKLKRVLPTYILEAIRVEKAGLKVNYKKTAEFTTPEEFTRACKETPGLKTAFEALTPGRQRAYLLYFAGAKQAKTRESRVEKSTRQILAGKGLDD